MLAPHGGGGTNAPGAAILAMRVSSSLGEGEPQRSLIACHGLGRHAMLPLDPWRLLTFRGSRLMDLHHVSDVGVLLGRRMCT